MDTSTLNAGKTWTFFPTFIASGTDSMRFDEERLETHAPYVRLFRFVRPTVSFGRLQQLANIATLIPAGWDAVQRPTGGGVVFHENDLCISLAWETGTTPLPDRLVDVYPWIHAVVLEAMGGPLPARLATCRDTSCDASAFETRDCFTHPVAFDILSASKKIVGGALCRRKNRFLYQGSIQLTRDETLALESPLLDRFRQILLPA